MNFDTTSFNNIFDLFDSLAYGVGNFAHVIYSLLLALPPIFQLAIIFSIAVACICLVVRAITL